MSTDRSGFDQAISTMTVSSSSLSSKYVFYMYMVSQCRVSFDSELPAPAAVNFQYDHYNLYINPITFNELPVEHRVGTIKHEMLHILYQHIWRKEERNHKVFNLATDCALNQQIDPKHLPNGVIYPSTLSNILGIKVPENLTAEQYYEFFQDLTDQHKKSLPNGDSLDDHSKWEESNGDEMIAKDLAKNMLDKAVSATQKGRGDLPYSYSDIVKILSRNAQVNWRQVLRRIVGNKRVGVTPSIFKPNRRQPDQCHIKGRIKDRKYDLLVVADVSGSVSDTELISGISEIRNICKLTNTDLQLIQVDTHAYPPEKVTRSTNIVERKARGGTVLAPAIQCAKEYNVHYDCIVVVTDGGICDSDINAFEATGKKVIWLLTQDMPLKDFIHGRMQAFKLK